VQLPPANWFAPPDGNRSRLFLSDKKHSFRDFPAGSREGTSSLEGGFECNLFSPTEIVRGTMRFGIEGNMQRRAIANYPCH
jgi:hypothetical protein